MEAEPLKLTAEHFPLPGSLRELVIHRYTTLASTASDMPPMELPELIGYLRSNDYLELTPMQSILAQTEAIGDPAMPAPEHAAILDWIGVVFEQWETHFPLEQALLYELRRLKPLAAKLAITNRDFLIPGRHPLHLLLDSLQLAAVGWQTRLGKIGEAVRKQVCSAVEDALICFEKGDTKLAALSAQVVAATERDLARASRMAQRTIETEQGRIKTAEAKRTAAGMINAVLEQFRAPPSVGKFLKGPWYESAQLVLLKFGAESREWTQMKATTTIVLESVQIPEEDEDPAKRQLRFDVVTQLPRELRRWLLSLQHDSDNLRDAMGMVEYAHIQILRKRGLEFEQTELIPVAAADKARVGRETLAAVQAGQWFKLDRDDGKPLRVRLALRIEETGELLFGNQAGIKVLRLTFDEFAGLLAGNKASLLDVGASFSRSLAQGAGIETVHDLESAMGPVVIQARDEAPARPKSRQVSRSAIEPGAGNESATIDLPMGTWLGFHDGDNPLMAKLAVHDRQNNNYTFVNRSGIKMRQLTQGELLDLMHKNLVDILETRSNFKDQVTRAKRKSED